MNRYLLTLFILFKHGQELNPLTSIATLYSPSSYQMTINNDRLVVMDNTKKTLLEYNTTTNILIDSVTFPFNLLPPFAINDQIYVGSFQQSTGATGFLNVPIYSLRSSYVLTNLQKNMAGSILMYGSYLIIGTDSTLERWNYNTLSRIEQINIGTTYDVKIVNSSVFVGGSLGTTNSNDLQERNVLSLSQLYFRYVGHTDAIYSLATQGKYVYSGSWDFSIIQWDMTTKQKVKQYQGHTGQLESVVISGQYMFSGADDFYWFQWDLTTGQAIRKTNTNNFMCQLIVSSPYLFLSGANGLLKYKIPELASGTSSASSGSNGQQASQGSPPSPASSSTSVSAGGVIQSSSANFTFTKDVNKEPITTSTLQSTPNGSYLTVSSTSSSKRAVETTRDKYFQATATMDQIQETNTLDFVMPTYIKNSTTASPKSDTQNLISDVQALFNGISLTVMIVIFALAFVILFLLGILIYCFCCRRRKQPYSLQKSAAALNENFELTPGDNYYAGNENTVLSEIFTNKTITNLGTAYTQNTTFMNESFTLIGTKNAYSIPAHLEIKSEEIRILQTLAKGGQASIFIAEVLNSDLRKTYHVTQVIVKSNGVNFEELSEKRKKAFYQELSIMNYFREQQGFVTLFGYTTEPVSLVMKYYPLGNLENIIHNRAQFKRFDVTMTFVLNFLLELASILNCFHNAGFVHCDLKPGNILIESDEQNALHPILTDFGITCLVSDQVLSVKAMEVENLKGFSLFYGAPEQMIEPKNTKRLNTIPAEVFKRRDIYGFSGILYALMMRKDPWS